MPAYLLTAALDSVRQLEDGSGNVVLAKGYEPYGEVMNSAGTASTSYGFTSEWTDNTGIVYLRARYYDPTIGRFMTRDSWGGDMNKPMSYNPWLYGYSNPVINVDPSGRRPYIPGLCPVPPPGATNFTSPDFLFAGKVYVYCGEFQLTAYQFVVDEDYKEYIMATAAGGFSVSLDFALDVEDEGTGKTSKASWCRGGYISKVSVDQHGEGDNIYYTFTYSCGAGKQYFPPASYYGRVAAADLDIFQIGANLYLPKMCGGGRPCNIPEYNPHITVQDAGGGIVGYKLDIFAGEGKGQRADSNAPSYLWSNHHSYLGDHAGFVGPTSVYQSVYYWWEELLISSFSCRHLQIPR